MIEFALVVAPFLALLIASLETSLVYFCQEALETAAEASARSISTGSVQSASTTQANFLKAACAQLPAYMTCSRLLVDVKTATNFSDVDTSAPTITYDKNGNITNSWNYTMGGSGDIVVLKLMYIWPVSTGPLGFDLSNMGPGKRLLIATSVAKTEPYQQ